MMRKEKADNQNMFVQRVSNRIYFFLSITLIMGLAAAYATRAVFASVNGPSNPDSSALVSGAPAPLPNPVISHKVADRRVMKELAFGSSLADLLVEAGLSGQEAYDVSMSLSDVLDMTRIKEGQDVEVLFREGIGPAEVIIPVSYEKTIVARFNGEEWHSSEYWERITAVTTVAHATVDSSLYQAAKDAGIPLSIMMEAIGLFSFEVDFQRDIQSGEEIVLLYDKLLNEEGEVVAAGDLRFASLKLDGRDVEAWSFESLDGKEGYFESSGDSVRKALLKTPVDGARISSGFGYRTHPILGYGAVHRGIDFAVARGTPVMAAGEGSVIIAGWHEQYGYRVKVRHANHYDTMYAHFTSIARGIRPGVRVEQGQVVGYVGSTGMSTGPHCHYEVHYYGSPVNPSELKFPPGRKLEGEDLRLFKLQRLALLSEFSIK